ncbi:hypothetical protein HN997_03855, partial [archaeon]|nr:hypothetical protein [archaeon]
MVRRTELIIGMLLIGIFMTLGVSAAAFGGGYGSGGFSGLNNNWQANQPTFN